MEWISIGERLPEEIDIYLVWLKPMPMEEGYPGGPELAVWGGRDWDLSYVLSAHTVTHWTVIEPPEEVGNAQD